MTKLKVYDFMAFRKIAVVCSAVLLSVSIWSLSVQGLVLGIDFSGGTQIEVGYEQPADVGALSDKQAGFENPWWCILALRPMC